MGASISDTNLDDDHDFGETHEINVTPFIDVMLVLLIIFMVAAPLSTVDLPVDLPTSTATPQKKPDKPKEPVYISIQDSGSIFIAEQQTTIETLAADVCVKVGNPTEEVVMIRADGDVRYEQFMNILNTLQDAGYYKVGLISEDLS